MKRLRRRGFTLIELLVVFIVLTILASMMVLRYIDLKHRAVSAKASADLDAIRKAGYMQFYDTGGWAPDAGGGVVPPALAPYLARGFTFVRPEYTLQWENLSPPGGGGVSPYTVAVRLVSPDARLMQTLSQTIGNRSPYIMMGNELVVIVVGPDGRI